MPAVVSDTSVLHYLSVTGQFDCLPKLFGHIFIPTAVWHEINHVELAVYSLVTKGIAQGWIKVESPHDQQAVQSLQVSLGAGESEAIVLAGELQPSLVLMDDWDGRIIAKQMKLPVMGTVGILAYARQQKFIYKLKPLLDELIATHRFRFDKNLYFEILREAGELE
jgi:predicted nucleic acid-binding protein